ncbi:VOC family protein [Nocardioides sp. LS1]|uniref:VOC family protein n=1 Tax=Nocardioides sp. LS1 TaxID=1027620 RepID=UPI000F622D07|nr:VOC family protein [Nocardioides sp. LS1]GCD92259.1 glyoxalase [Nocardioides sp. LS1]
MVDWQLTIDANDPARLVQFWAPVLGYEVQPPPEPHASWKAYYLSLGVPDDELPDSDWSDRIWDPTGAGPRIWFQIVPEEKAGKNRLHLDIFPTGRDRTLSLERRRVIVEAKVAELVGRGARVRHRSTDLEGSEGVDHYGVTMLDPEGNEFCVA